MPLSEKLLNSLICPVCHERFRTRQDSWECLSGHTFDEINGVPILRDTTDMGPFPEGNETTGWYKKMQWQRAEGLIGKIRDLISTNYEPFRLDPKELVPPGALVLNAGSGFAPKVTGETINLDYYLLPPVDLVADVHRIPFESNTFDLVISDFVIEHVVAPPVVCSEMMRVLRPGGLLYVTYPFIISYHAFPDDYFRFTLSGMMSLLPGMRLQEHRPLTGPASAWLSTTADFLCLLLLGDRPGVARFILRAGILASLFPIKYLDLFLNRRASAGYHSATLLSVFRKVAE